MSLVFSRARQVVLSFNRFAHSAGPFYWIDVCVIACLLASSLVGWLVCGLNGVRMSVHVLRCVNENTYKIGPLSGGGTIVNVLLVFLGSPCQTKGFRFCFGSVLALFWSLWRSQGLHFGSLGAPFWHPWGCIGLQFGSSGGLLSAVGGSLLTPGATG